jgi:hypothetical protein
MNYFARKLRDWRNMREIRRRREAAQQDVVQAMEIYHKDMSKVSEDALMDVHRRGKGAFLELPVPKFSLKPYTPPFDAIAPHEHVLAMDTSFPPGVYAQGSGTGMFANGGFPGFPFLTELMQINEYRDLCESTPNEMTRKWIEFRTTGDDDRDDIIEKIEAKMKELHIKE